MTLVVATVGSDDARGFKLRGGAREFWRSHHHEVMLSGPSETGKTFAACQKLHCLLLRYPNCQAVMVRKTLESLRTTVLQTFLRVIGSSCSSDGPIRPYGGEKHQWIDYPNRSRLYLAGFDKPEKVLSSERDFIYVNQAEELSLSDWEYLTTRCTGRAGNSPYPQILGDCNPRGPNHWIRQRVSLQRFESRHEDNPTLFDEEGRITERGRLTMEILDRLTGLRHKRLRLGLWVTAEGTVYEEWNPDVHVIDPFQIPADWRRIRVIDFGYANPFVCQWWAIDGDGRMYLYRELYRTQRIVADHAHQIRELSSGERIEATPADHDAEDRATLEREGIHTTAAHKAVTPGIEAVQQRIRIQGDGKPRLMIFRNALIERDEMLAAARKPTCTAEEIEGYIWAPAKEGRAPKEEPVKLNDHGMDAMRYAVAYVDGLGVGHSGPSVLFAYREPPQVQFPNLGPGGMTFRQ